MSFHSWPFLGEIEWVGLGNYEHLFSWKPFYTSLMATFIYAFTTFIQLAIALVAALIVANLESYKNIISGMFLLPYTFPPIVAGTVWMFLLNPNFGPIFQYLHNWGVIDQIPYWSVNGDTALAAVMGATAWAYWPWMFVILLASVQNIPEPQYESARIYGANRIQSFFRITLPQLKTAILIAISIRMIWNLSKISLVFQMTQGGPGYDTSILAVLLYRFGWNTGQMGRGYAVGIILLLLTLVFVFLFIREFHRSSQEVQI